MTTATAPAKWPKTLAPLTAEQQRISDDFMRHWHEVLPARYGVIERFNHGYPVRTAPAGFTRTLEVGAGRGEHLAWERLTPAQLAGYHMLELRANLCEVIRARHPGAVTVQGDCQARLDYPDGHFDRILAIHVLEHLPDLPAAVRELRRLCDPARGVLQVVIPCEGGLAYGLARRVSARRIFEARYGQPYDWFITREHLNRPDEVLEELAPHFVVERRRFFPLRVVPSPTLNLVIGLTLCPRERAR